MWPPSEYRGLYLYPRVHPLWHKSRVDAAAPDTAAFPRYADAGSEEVVLRPGDVLYLPPYTFHAVESLTPSVSLATLSHDDAVRDRMEQIYRTDIKSDRLVDPAGRRYALRLFLDLMVEELLGAGPAQSQTFFAELLRQRFEGPGVEPLFAPFGRGAVTAGADTPGAAGSGCPGQVPTSAAVYGDVFADVQLVAPHFGELAAPVLDMLLGDYAEELAAEAVGARHVPRFFQSCFRGQDYVITDPSSAEHARLWRYYDEEDDGAL